MELVNTDDDNFFDPTPKLKPSPIPISFVPFDNFDKQCFDCGDEYTETLFFGQKYCKKCLSQYINDTAADNNAYLDMCIYTMNSECNKHKTSRNKESLIQNIQDWCNNCSGVSYFKQMYSNNYSHYSDESIESKIFENEKDCKLCGKLICQNSSSLQEFEVCSNCYLISSGWIESTMTKQPVPILYLPWWSNDSNCRVCASELEFTSDCQKYCTQCGIIYIGCRYCLTTNIIFGFADQSQCKKCKKISLTIINTNNTSGILDDFSYDLTINPYNIKYTQLAKIINDDVKRTGNLEDIYRSIREYPEYPTLLGSNPRPIFFIPFNIEDSKCLYCEDEYSHVSYRYSKKYCRKCLSSYIADINNNGNDSKSSEHEIIKNEYSNCCQISVGYIESTLTKQPVQILYLPWWDNNRQCIAYHHELISSSGSQKHCPQCCVIYIGCRYCLTTNIIFGFVDQSQCNRCKRILLIDITKVKSGNRDFDDLICGPNLYNDLQLDKAISEISKVSNKKKDIYNIISNKYKGIESEQIMEWISYTRITNLNKIAEGGYGIIYTATWLDGPLNKGRYFRKKNETVIVKKIKNIKYFLNELKSNQRCYKLKHHVVRIYGITKDLESNDYMLVMQYASEGDLHKYLQREFTKITWNKEKLRILWQISEGLETIHDANFIHRDFHSGNILFDSSRYKRHQWQIGDFGLSQPANNTSNNDEIYGVIPYIAPEIFNGSPFSKESDVYAFGMIMWEITAGCKPFANIEHDISLIYQIIDGKRPEITDDTPECFADLMKSCWDSDPKKRPTITEIRKIFGTWFFRNKNIEQFDQAEEKRRELIYSKIFGPNFNGEYHPEAILTSRSLSPFISKVSSNNSTLAISLNYSQDNSNNVSEYTTKEHELDIDIPRNSSKKRKIEVLNLETNNNDGKFVKTNNSSKQ